MTHSWLPGIPSTKDAATDMETDLVVPAHITEITALQKLIRECPIIDHHAHPLVGDEQLPNTPLESLFTDDSISALEDASRTFLAARAIDVMSKVYKCDATLTDIKTARNAIDRGERTLRCFEGVSCMLIDTGIRLPGQVYYSAHNLLVPNPCKRIVRIESVAEDIMKHQVEEHKYTDDWLVNFNTWLGSVEVTLNTEIHNDEVAGFKTVMCFRGGLKWKKYSHFDVEYTRNLQEQLQQDFMDWIIYYQQTGDRRLNKPLLVDNLLRCICERLEISNCTKPLQVHSGFGHTDVVLRMSNAAYMEEFFHKYKKVQFILLHSNYPFVIEGGYLAKTYENVYLDISLVFHKLSREGQKKIVKQILELAPNKILYSTDGHPLPEGFLIANTEARDVLSEVITKRVQSGRMTVGFASELIQNLFFNNANKLYNLNLPPQVTGFNSILKSLPKFEDVFGWTPGAKFVRLMWVDYCNQVRLQVLPISTVRKSFGTLRLDLPKAPFSMIPNGSFIPGPVPSGSYVLKPDWKTARSADSYASGHVTVQSWIEEDGEPLDTYPRTILKSTLEAASEMGLEFSIAFELEFVLYPKEYLHRVVNNRPVLSREANSYGWFDNIAMAPASTVVMDEIATALETSNVQVVRYHPGSAPNQFTLLTAPSQPMEAVDVLYHARNVIRGIAQAHNTRATFHPNPWIRNAGNRTHAHVSLATKRDEQENFFAGVVGELRGLSAFGHAAPCGYEITSENLATKPVASYVCWGEEFMEAPIRRISEDDAHWKLQCLDGTANVYLFFAAMIRAGIAGIRNKRELPSPCPSEPTLLPVGKRESLGIVKLLPKTLDEALNAMDDSRPLLDGLGPRTLAKYRAIKRAEVQHIVTLAERDRYIYEIERY
ncbi:glutamine synthetase/guanido kinase [Ascodesmis nigricans]|uniref:Glutamine synthetase/guanido kinase n=1 Tax=Ascodesmis nigricans TaxID=341454 RepID=A0A4S2MJC3_9PEZI|nr:glutamine synthetase/guanido kinase [Ascodesmis nigricans]